MGSSKEYKLAIKIAGEMEKSFYNSTRLTKKELASIARQASATSATFSESFASGLKQAEPAFNGLEKVGKQAFEAIAIAATAATAATAAVVSASISAGQSFESAFAGVKKTTDATASEYEELRQGILAMSEQLPASADEIAEVAEAAGQLGIKKENLLDFTRVMIDLGESTNMTATDSASSLAKFANITNMAADKYSNLGSVIVDLGNNFATTESDIVAMGTRLAASGELVGLSQAQIMALAAAMSSVGVEAEAGGSAMSKLLKNIQVAVETGGKSLTKYAKVAGMTGDKFKKAFGEDALGATSAFITGLNDTERNGKSAIAILDDMGLTEVRLSNTILSLANANGVMTDAIDTANSAWKENTALTNEASQRYATAESQVEMLKNKVNNIGISIYDDLRKPYTEVIALVSDTVSEIGDTIEESGIFKNAAKNFSKELPTVVRQTKQLGDSVGDFAQPFLKVGGWLKDNPGIIAGTITSVGSALATYKVANGVLAIGKALGSLGPAGAAIGLGALAVGSIVGISTAIKKSAAEAKRANLDGHFGDITLSLRDLEKVASGIIASGSLTQVRQAIEEFDKLDSIQGTIDDLSSEIAKANWEVSVGISMSADDATEYKSNIEEYINQCQEYVNQQRYAINLAVGVLTDDDLEGQNIVDQVNDFYIGKQSELAALGTQLNQAITDAFQDGLLDMDEAQRVSEIQAQMAEIQAQLAGTNFDANLEMLSINYGENLDAESFQNLQAELAEQVEAAKADYEGAFTSAAAGALAMLQDGAIDQSGYNDMIAEFKENYLEQVGEIELKAANFQTETIMNQYKDEIEAAAPQLQQITQDAFSNSFAWENNPLQAFTSLTDSLLDGETLDKDTQAAIADLYAQLAPSQEMMQELAQEYMDAGEEIPQALIEGLNNAALIGTLAGDEDSVWTYLGSQISGNEDYQNILDAMTEAGGEIPAQLATALDENQHIAVEAAQNLYKDTDESIQNTFAAGFDVEATVRMNMIPQTTGVPTDAVRPTSTTLRDQLKVGHKDGGIFDTPHIAWFAENGPEAAIPLDGSQNAISLWEETGKLLGQTQSTADQGRTITAMSHEIEKTSTSTYEGGPITYAPTLQFNGAAPSKADLDEALQMSEERFAEMLESYMRRNARLSFAQ